MKEIVWTPKEITKRSFYLLLTIMLFPVYCVSYAVKRKRKKMESLGEWLTMWCNPNYV